MDSGDDMFIREYKTKNKKTGAVYITHKLVESHQTEKGPRQAIVMTLGKISVPKSEWRKLAYALEQRLSGQQELFPIEPEVEEAVVEIMKHHTFTKSRQTGTNQRQKNRELLSVDLSSLATTHSRSLGPELIGYAACERLDFRGMLKDCQMADEDAALATALVLAKLIAPDSDLATWKWLGSQSSLPELLGLEATEIRRNAVYEMADILFAHKDRIEDFLRNKERVLFPQQTTLFLYDLTNTYFEGNCAGNPMAQRGKSKEKRSDCPLVSLSLLVDSQGFPIFSEIYKGNQSEPGTFLSVLDRLRKAEGHCTPLPGFRSTIVMDRGIATKENIALLKEREYPYIVVERRAVEKEYIHEFEHARETFEEIVNSHGDTVYIKRVDSDSQQGCRVLALSETRELKEIAIDQLKEERFLHGLESLNRSVTKGTIKLSDKVNIRIGRLLERYPSISYHYTVDAEMDEKQEKVTGIHWIKKESREQRSSLNGCYVIETSHDHLDAAEIWKSYTTLTRVEAAFRALKSDLGVRPIFHQQENRTKAHLFLSVLAYHVLNTIEISLGEKGYHHRWPTVRKITNNHQRSTIIMTDAENKIHHLRLSGTPESATKEIYNLLDIKDPLKTIHTKAGQRL